MKKTKEKKGSSGGKDWEKRLSEKASKESSREKAGTGGLENKLSIRNRVFTFGGEKLGKKIKGAVVDFAYLNTYYGKKFSEDEQNIPKCFAISEDGEDMEPHENVTKPQNGTCEGCPKNEWGSGRGRGKACAERRRLAIIDENDLEDADSVAEAEWAMLELPPTSITNWSSFVAECTKKLNRPYYTVMVEIAFDADASYPIVTFSIEEKIKDKGVCEALEKLNEDGEIREMLMKPYDSTDDEDDEDDEDEDEDDKPRNKNKSKSKKSKSDKKSTKKRGSSEDDDEDDDEDDEDDKKSRKKRKSKKDDDDDDSDDEDSDDEDDEEDDEDDDEDDEGKKGKGIRGSKRRSKDDDDGDDDDDDEDEDDDDEDAKPKRKGKAKRRAKDEDDDEEDEEDSKTKRKKGSRFGK